MGEGTKNISFLLAPSLSSWDPFLSHLIPRDPSPGRGCPAYPGGNLRMAAMAAVSKSYVYLLAAPAPHSLAVMSDRRHQGGD